MPYSGWATGLPVIPACYTHTYVARDLSFEQKGESWTKKTPRQYHIIQMGWKNKRNAEACLVTAEFLCLHFGDELIQK